MTNASFDTPGGSVHVQPLQRPSRRARVILALSALLAAATVAGITIGAVPIPLPGAFTGNAELSQLQRMVLMELRIPRVLLAGVVGAALAVAGAALQGLFRNPLAEPQLIGVSAGAALGAIAVIVFGNHLNLPAALRPYALPLAAVLGAAAVTAGLYAFASRRRDLGMGTLLLVGIAVNALAAVGIGAFTYLADEGQLRSLTFWTMGSFGGADWQAVTPAAVFIAGAMLLLLPLARPLDLLQLGEVEAGRLGIAVPRIKRRVVFAAAGAVGAGVAVSGMIGFIGLVVPHLARLLGGASHAYLLPASAILGAALAVFADLGARTFIAPAELPVGLITSAIGAPFFLWLIVQVRRT